MKRLIEIDEDLQMALNEYFEGKRAYVGLDNGIKLLEAVKNGKEIKDDILLPEKPNKSETKIDCDNADCNNCVNHKYCDYEKFDAVMDNMLKYPSTTKNDLPHCQHTDEEIAKSFIEDVEAVKDQLPCGEQMDFPDTFDEFAEDYGFKDKDEVYTNDSELIPVFRVKQWLEHISITKNNLVPRNVVERIIKSPRTKEQMLSVLNSLPPQESIVKNDLVVDCISRIETIDYLCKHCPDDGECFKDCDEIKHLRQMPSVTPQPRWIPCSEKKPNKGGEYLLWGKIDESDEEDYYFLGDYYEFEEKFGIEKSNYDPHTLGFLDTEIEEYYSVVAWMPLPKAYSEVDK